MKSVGELPRLVIVGNGMVGQRLVDELIERGAHKSWEIVVIGEEPLVAYDRVQLSAWFDGASIDDLNLVDQPAMTKAGIEYRTSCMVKAINRDAKTVTLDSGTLDSGEDLAYEHLVMATGSYPFVPPIPGREVDGVYVYRTIEDLENIASRAKLDNVTCGAVIGGGLLGLEAANALLNLGLETHVIEMAPHLMPAQLNAEAAEMLTRHIEALGVNLHLGAATKEIVGNDDDGITSVAFADGTSVDAQLLVFSAGIRARDELARDAGLEVGERGGLVVDEQMLSADPSISAVGEVASVGGMTYGLVAPGYDMAAALADRLAGSGETSFASGDLSAKLKLLGVDVASFGTAKIPEGAPLEQLVYRDPLTKVHRELIIDEAGVVQGGLLVGDASGYQQLRMMATGVSPTPENVASLVLPEGLSAEALDPTALVDEAQICSCNGVSAGDLRAAVDDGCLTPKAVAACTKAGTSCGGCMPDVTSIVHARLESSGHTVDHSLCEHFAYTRQELYDLVRLNNYTSWAEVINAHGTGLGCAICRPVVASVLASRSNGYILDGDQASVQDTNDHSLANMQRNGTYSVIPRVPGGEITPAQLIGLGQIAEDFNLYTKITGGQRIDLLGAQLHELPLIWQRVLDLGLESGHAYGKALRTVKSCVGDTWCRYGVQDSVTMAIELEKRYRGLRAPHKLKSAVSGCVRECAEARGKDFGIIATELGWNLYVGGNGGKTPRHADLLLTDADDETLIRTIDRFLMFYIRTADRLQRTSAWLKELEGGVDYLRTVVVDDVLGIGEELEAEMQKHVDTYECEWEATLNDADRRASFVEFVNAPDQNSTPVWITERSQRVPAPRELEVTR